MKNEEPKHGPQEPGRQVPHYGQPAYYDIAYGGEPAGRDEEEGIDLLKLVRVLLRRWVTVLILLVIGVLGALLYLQLATPVYRAEAELEMSVRRPKVINSQAVFDDSVSARDTDAIINTRFAKFRSPAMETMAWEEYRSRYPDEAIERKAFEAFMRHQVEWTKERNANIVRVSADSPDARMAAQLVNVLIYCSGELMIRENEAQSDGAVEWLSSQLEEHNAALEQVDKQLADLRRRLQLDSLRQRKEALGEALNEISTQRITVENELEARRTTFRYVEELAAEGQDFKSLPSDLPKAVELNQLVAEWRASVDALAQVSDKYTEEHPEYQRLQGEIDRTHQRLNDFISDLALSIRSDIRLLERQLAQLETRMAAMEEQAITLEEQVVGGEQQVQSLERRREVADQSYQDLLTRMQEARLSSDENTAFINVIHDAQVPVDPVRPRKLIVLFLGLFLGGGAGCSLALLMEFWADKIMLVSDLKELHLNILGTIPTQKKVESRGDHATVGFRDKFSHVFEIFAGINTLLSSGKYRDRTGVLLVCSVMPAEGKTVTACNLAIAAALNGSRTLLIDGDLRRPRLARIFDIPEDHPSLLEWLSAEDPNLDFAHLVTPGVHGVLDVITSRAHRDTNPAELLGRGRLADLIHWARGHYDRVIIDSPPLGLVGDTQALADQADSVVIVSRLGVTRKRALKFALGRMVELDAFVIGCIANDVPHSISGLFGGGEHGYAYGYGTYKSYGRDAEDDDG